MGQKICLVTEELAGFGASGGIGAAFLELAIVMAKHGYDVDLIFAPLSPLDAETKRELYVGLGAHRIAVRLVELDKFVWDTQPVENRSYGITRYLLECGVRYDVIHFHDYKGLGFFTQCAKRQGLGFKDTELVVQLHGPTKWTQKVNGVLCSHLDQLKIDFLESKSASLADRLVSPSEYMVKWMRDSGPKMPAAERVSVIKNPVSLLPFRQRPRGTERIFPDEIIFFGRHEPRKGISVFCEAIDRIASELSSHQTRVSFVGALGRIRGRSSGIPLTQMAANWSFPIALFTNFSRNEALAYFRAHPRALIVVPSPEENSPYTVAEALSAGNPIVTSSRGGARELIAAADHEDSLCDIDAATLAKKVLDIVTHGTTCARPAEKSAAIEKQWTDFHESLAAAPAFSSPTMSIAHAGGQPSPPKIVFGITHYERPAKLIGAVLSAMRQTYANIEIVVVDDGSKSQQTLAQLDILESLLARCNGRLIRQDNRYLGAARNTIARETQSDHLIFLDDDDIALPWLAERLVDVARTTDADVVNCLNLFMEESRRHKAVSQPEQFRQKVSYVPLGGPLSLAAIRNVMGAATALIKRSFFEQIGGYSELRGAGFEDYEFYVRALQAGGQIEIVPEPLYLYETAKASMLTTTSVQRNQQRVVSALAFDTNAGDWRDLVSLMAGQEAEAQESNRAAWEHASSADSACLIAIEDAGGDRVRLSASLARYAEHLGAAGLAKIWRRSVTGAWREDSEDRIVANASLQRLAARHEDSETLLATDGCDLELQVHLALCRHGSAHARLIALLDQRDGIDEDFVSNLNLYVMFGEHADGERVAGLAKRLLAHAAPKALAGKLSALIFELAWIANAANLLECQWRQIEKIGNADYCTEYPDIAKAVREGYFSSGMKHYADHGYTEGRSGFETMWTVCDFLRSRPPDAAAAICPWDIEREVRDKLAEIREAPREAEPIESGRLQLMGELISGETPRSEIYAA